MTSRSLFKTARTFPHLRPPGSYYPRISSPYRSFAKMTSVNGKHAPFKEVEASREPFDSKTPYKVTQIVGPDWKVPEGVNEGHPAQASFEAKNNKTREIKPEDIDAGTNYKLLMCAYSTSFSDLGAKAERAPLSSQQRRRATANRFRVLSGQARRAKLGTVQLVSASRSSKVSLV